MIFYILDSSFNRKAIIDTYESAIWTDRYLEPGDFELYIKINDKIPSDISMGRYLIHKDSEHAMIIEKIQIETDLEDGNKLTVKGRSLESILDRRIVWRKTIFDKNKNLQDAVRQLITENIISPNNDDRKISNFVFLTSNDINVAGVELSDGAEYYGEDLLEVVKKLCDTYKIGFKIILDTETKKLKFSLYAGKYRANRLDPNTYVAFSQKTDSLLNSSYSDDTENYKNVTFCVGPAEDVYEKVAPTGDENPHEEGWYKWDPNQKEYIDTYDEYVRWDQTYYEKDDLEKKKMKETVGEAKGLNRREVFTDCGSASRQGEITYDKATITEYQHHPKEEGWYKQHFDPDGGLEYIKAQEDDPIPGVQYYWKNTHSRDDADFSRLLIRMGKEKLTEKKRKEEFEGEVDYTTSMFKYGKHYKIGDIVRIINTFGLKAETRVTEYTYSDDVSDGLKCHPTFEMVEED